MANVNRRQFVQMTMALSAFTAVAGGRQVLAAGDQDAQGALVQLSMSEAARRIRARQLTSTELTKAFLQRIEIYNPKLNAFITVMGDEALRQAALLDSEANAGKFRGPLHGLPIVLKDNIDTAGTRTTAASLVWRSPTLPAKGCRPRC